MSLDFVEHFEQVGRRIRQRQWTAAACWTLAGAAAAALLLTAADQLIGVYHFAGRALLTSLFVAAVVVIWRRASRGIAGQKTPLEVALWVERHDPELRSLLASGVEFSGQDPSDLTAGSAELRRAVVLRAALASGRFDLPTTAARQAPLGKATAAAAIALAAVAATTAWAPQGVAIGLARLVNPFTQLEWPRRHDLAFIDPPAVVAIGGDFRVQLEDRRGALPANVVVEFRAQRQGRWRYDSQRYAPDGSVLDVVWPQVQGPFEFRARGGDHRNMPWRRVTTATAPRVEALRVAMRAPAYSGWPERSLEEPFRVLQGSTLDLAARTTEPVTTAQLEAENQPSVPLRVSEDGHGLVVAREKWRPAVTAEWSFRLTTPGGLTMRGVRPLRVEVTPDQPPTATLVSPVEDLALLSTARIELSVEATDDVGVNEVTLELQAIEAGEASDESIETVLFRAAGRGDVLQQTVDHGLELKSLAIEPGSTWEVRVVARDLADQETLSQPPLRVRVITLEQFTRRVEAEFARLRAVLESAYNHQRDALTRVESWSPDIATIQWPAVDQGLAALTLQRQASQPLAGGQDAAVPVIEALMADYRRNGLTADNDLLRLVRLHAALDALTREALPAIESSLQQFVRELELVDRRSTDSATAARQLSDIEQRQGESLAVLEAALRELSRWSEVQQFRREIAELGTEQETVLDETEAAARAALQAVEQPSRSTGADRQTSTVVSAQREIAARLTNVLGRMQQTSESLAASEPADRARLDAALKAAERTAVRLNAFTAADHLAAARFGQAADAERKVGRGLHQVLDRLGGSDSQEAERRLAELKNAEQQVEALRQQTEAMAKAQEAAQRAEAPTQSEELEDISRERRKIAVSVRQLTQQLKQMNVSRASKSAARAQQNLSRRQPSSQSDRRAASDLEQAKQELADERRQQQALLAQIQMQRLESALQTLVAGQQEVLERLSTAATGDVAPLAERQGVLRSQTRREAGRLESVPVFSRSLNAAADAMQEAENELKSGGARADRAATRALDQLKRLADAVRQPQNPQQSAAPPPGQQPPPSGAGRQNPAKAAAQAQMLQLAIAQLTILRKMQTDLETETAELERTFAAGGLGDADLSARSAKLAAEQKTLSELAAAVVRDAELPPIQEESESP